MATWLTFHIEVAVESDFVSAAKIFAPARYRPGGEC
jgi:hypothetical protein